MKIKKIIHGVENLEIKGSKELDVMGLSSHSKLVQPKDLFIAKKSKDFTTQKFIDEAVKSGATAIACDIYNPFLKQIVQLIHSDPASIEAQLAENFYAHTKKIIKYFVSGTNGKTTCCFMLHHLLGKFSKVAGLLTTISRMSGQHVYPARLTTEDLITNYKDFHLMASDECSHAVVEASSHGLDQDRLKGIDCRVAVFTNLSHDHLDYHGTMDEYLGCKLRLLDNLNEEGVVVVNLDCPYFSKINMKRKTLYFSLLNPAADLFVEAVNGPWFSLNFQGCRQEIYFDLIGEYNLSNALACILTLLFEGFRLSDFKWAFKDFCLPKGRLDEVTLSNGARVFIDFAHTPCALSSTLKALRAVCKKRLFVVFGCGGNRDGLKRSKMTESACQFADQLIFTSDNPRDEDPMFIIDQMKKGLDQRTDYKVIENRDSAIGYCLNLLRKGDVLCIAGKGHEEDQVIGATSLSFSDKSVVQKYAKDLDLIHV